MSSEPTLAQELMADFAAATGVVGTAPQRRYLWTDAFAVCNFLGFHRQRGEEHDLNLALALVDQAHWVLGRHREDDSRRGWISGLPEDEGQKHPTRGGLRIGKPRGERGPDERGDEREEWDRDGQYFHYLTKWMHALCRVAEATGVYRYLRWAVELALTAQRAFTYEALPGGPKQMVWKMSIDLRRPLVASMGHHDPLDGLATFLELDAAGRLPGGEDLDLAPAIAAMSEMCQEDRWATNDPLGVGGLLGAAARLAQTAPEGRPELRQLLRDLLVDAERSLAAFSRLAPLEEPAERRLAFRELGLSIGLHAMAPMAESLGRDPLLAALVERLLPYRPLAEEIEAFWSDPTRRQSETWAVHRDINTVMLATSLAPEGYLRL